MRILMISDVYFPRINGVSTSIQTFRGEMQKLGHEVTLIAPDYGTDSTPELDTIRIPARKVILDPEDRMMSMSALMKLKDQLHTQNFDLIHVHTPFVAHYAGVKLSRFLNLPLVITYHTLFEEYLYHYIPFVPRLPLKKLARSFSRAQCNQADTVVAPSSIIVKLLKDYGVEQPIEVIPTGIHCDQFSKGNGAAFREKHGISNHRKVLLNVSRIAFEKNIGLLLEVVERVRHKIPEVCLLIAGEGPARKACMRRAEELDLQDSIIFVGYLDRDTELLDCYSSADFFVFSSQTETQGLVLLEAMAAGTPVVSVAAMGTRDILIDCAGAQIVENDVDQFSNSLIELLQDEAAQQRLRMACRSSAARWDSQEMAEKMLRHYRSVINDSAVSQEAAVKTDISV